jgi:hypothetical protein
MAAFDMGMICIEVSVYITQEYGMSRRFCGCILYHTIVISAIDLVKIHTMPPLSLALLFMIPRALHSSPPRLFLCLYHCLNFSIYIPHTVQSMYPSRAV